MIFPKTRLQVLHNYQVELENWVENAPIENIKQFITEIHGLVYPEDWTTLINSHFENSDYIQSCECCQEILSAVFTISQISRPELGRIFNIK
ncbi:hypothetical protein HT667_04670 [Ursidibacter maritimus]|uniref:hypothetical protein n=1 Tax=Ursidibacter maritimus TaxID=1331689 RepID=UPI001C445ECC|nr:hypothetical protein [Ursidibacter maritimus]MBV6540763.1 hypothetical protein [Ursidibacter maritimus]